MHLNKNPQKNEPQGISFKEDCPRDDSNINPLAKY